MLLQDAEIEFHRAVFKTKPVELHTMPRWWWERVCWITSGWGRFDAEDRMLNRLEDYLPFKLFDHWGASRGLFVTEPYQPYDDANVWGWTAAFAEMMGVHFRILPPWKSWWFPGRTIRIEFSPCHHDPICRRCKSREQMKSDSRTRKRSGQPGGT